MGWRREIFFGLLNSLQRRYGFGFRLWFRLQRLALLLFPVAFTLLLFVHWWWRKRGGCLFGKSARHRVVIFNWGRFRFRFQFRHFFYRFGCAWGRYCWCGREEIL
jgi:hypothetical protein